MRKIKSLDYTDVDTQQCRFGINEILKERKIEEKDIISIQKQWNDDPVDIYSPNGTEKGNVTLIVFYWSE